MVRRACSLAAVMLFTRIAGADPSEHQLEAARRTFEQGIRLEDAGRFEEALARFREVAAVKTSPQVHFHLSVCLHKVGKLVDAASELDKAREEAAALGPAGEPIVARATADRTELYAATPRLDVKLADGTRPRSIEMDGATITLGDEPVAIDPGHHHVVVTRSGQPPFESDVVVEERRPAMVADIVVADVPHGGGGVRVSPYAIVGASLTLVTLGASLVTGALQLSLTSKLDGECGPSRDACPPTATGDIDTARTLTTATDVLLVVAAVELAATVVLFFTTKPRARTTAFQITPFGVRGTF